MAKISDLIKYLEDIKEKNVDLEILRDITYLVCDVEDLGNLYYLESAKEMTDGLYDFEYYYENPDPKDFKKYLIM